MLLRICFQSLRNKIILGEPSPLLSLAVVRHSSSLADLDSSHNLSASSKDVQAHLVSNNRDLVCNRTSLDSLNSTDLDSHRHSNLVSLKLKEIHSDSHRRHKQLTPSEVQPKLRIHMVSHSVV